MRRSQQVAAAAVPLPEDIARFISAIRERLGAAEASDSLTALRIIIALDTVIGIDAAYITRAAMAKHTGKEIADALGSTPKALAARLRRYDSALL
ncbi:hypothetical protein [Streptomyces sp. NPDC004435]|uniref:hypothetical protein n=1 Tax=Streptomyces sp. NPDC004435 TaxID=3364701 RepID=UPI0036912603